MDKEAPKVLVCRSMTNGTTLRPPRTYLHENTETWTGVSYSLHKFRRHALGLNFLEVAPARVGLLQHAQEPAFHLFDVANDNNQNLWTGELHTHVNRSRPHIPYEVGIYLATYVVCRVYMPFVHRLAGRYLADIGVSH